jgi:hypothetical protein
MAGAGAPPASATHRVGHTLPLSTTFTSFAAGAAALANGTSAGELVLRRIFGGLDEHDLANLDKLLNIIQAGLGR